MTSITTSQAADLIIVGGFCILVYLVFLYVIGEAVCALVEFIQKKRKSRKERKAKKLEQKKEQET